MNNKKPLIIFIFSIVSVWIIYGLLEGSDTPLLVSGALVVYFSVKAAKSYWVALILGLLTVMNASLPYPILERIPIGVLTILFIVMVAFEEQIVKKTPLDMNLFKSKEPLFMLLAAGIILIRFLYDRPFSAILGSRGGGAQAFFYLTGAVTFFFAMQITSRTWDVKRNLNVLIVLLIGSAVIDFILYRIMVFDAYGSFISLFRSFFWGAMWFLPPLLLSLLLFRQEQSVVHKALKNRLSILIIIVITLALAFSTPFRSRPYFALAMILSVFVLYRQTKRLLPMLLGGIALALVILFSVSDSDLRFNLQRTLSTVYMSDESYYAPGEMGWKSGFRSNMLDSALEEIEENPFVGRGLSFPRDELMATFAGPTPFDINIQGLTLAGGYHNSIVTLAVTCGLPAALFFSIAFILTLKNYIRYLMAIPYDHVHLLGAGVLGFFLANTGQMLMNGGGIDFFIICVLMGFMNGLYRKPRAQVSSL